MIVSNQNALVKLLASLHRRAGREKAGLFLIEGVRLLEAALDAGIQIKHVVYSQLLEQNQRGMACLRRIRAEHSCRAELVTDSLLGSLADTIHPQGILAAAALPASAVIDLSPISRLVLVDGVQDPGNLGTVIRTADALGAQAVVTLCGTVDVWNEKVMRSAMGSLFHVRLWQGLTLSELLPLLRDAGFQLVASALTDAVNYDQARYAERVALAVGNEGAGISAELMQAADLRVTIPQHGGAESLNVAVATGIILAELARH